MNAIEAQHRCDELPVRPSEWTITLPILPMAMNERERVSFWKRKRELDEVAAQIGWSSLEQRIPAATGRRFVQITIHKSKRSRVKDDPANLPTRAKSILDALVRNQLLIDDNHAHLEWGGVTEGAKSDHKHTVITIRELQSAA